MNSRSTNNGAVVIAVDGSEQGYVAVRYAAQEAQRLGAALDVVHVLPSTVAGGSAMMMMVPEESFQCEAAQILGRARTTALESVPDLQVTTQLRMGGRIHQLIEISGHARLMVLGRRSPSSLDRIWSGGTVTGVASRAACPVVVVPDDREPGPTHRRIVVGFKSSAHASELFDAAFRLADEIGAEIVVLHAWRLQGVYDDIIADRVEVERWQREETELIENELADCRDAFPDVTVRVNVRHEDAARALVRATAGADRLVIERPAHGGLVHHLGRTARAVLREARCPVEVLPPVRHGAEPSAPPAVKRSGELVP
jgi:nucleotide-binding universal stress UspA family protein